MSIYQTLFLASVIYESGNKPKPAAVMMIVMVGLYVLGKL